MNFNLFNSLILAGVLQGFLFALVWLFTKKYRARSTFYLITLIVIYSLSNLQFYLLDIGYINYGTFYDIYYTPFSLIMPALMLLYGLSLLQFDTIIKKIRRIVFMPFVVIFSMALFYKYQLIVNKKKSGYSPFLDDIPNWAEYIAILSSFSVLLYLLVKVQRTISIGHARFSLEEVKPQLKWFRSILIVQIFTTILWAYSEYHFAALEENYYYYPLWIFLSIIIYWLGHMGIYKYGVTQDRNSIREHRNYKRIISEEKKEGKHKTIEALETFLISEKNFLNPHLSLDKTAAHLQLSSGHLSKIINTELQQSFKDYLNNLRVNEAKSYLKNAAFSNYTLVAIGLEAGFNSKSAFHASFKKITGLTPSQYKAQHTN